MTKDKCMKVFNNGNGYMYFTTSIDGIRSNNYIHRLVAESFIPNPENKSQVNHINGIKSDNRLENLEWCTPGENTKHAVIIGLRDRNKVSNAVLVLDTDTNTIFGTIKEASEYFNVKYSLLKQALNRKRKKEIKHHIYKRLIKISKEEIETNPELAKSLNLSHSRLQISDNPELNQPRPQLKLL